MSAPASRQAGRAPPGGLELPSPASVAWAPTITGAVAIVGASILLPRAGPNLAPADLVLALVVVWGLVELRTADPSPARGLARTIAPWLCLILAGSVVALTTVGITGPALVNLVQSTYAITILLAASAFFTAPRVGRRQLVWATGIAILVVAGGLIATWEPATRPAGTFYHPNYAGHFLAMATIVWWRAATVRPGPRLGVAIVGIAAILLTASFGALSMLVAASLPDLAAAARRRPWTVPAAAAVVSITVLLGVGPTIAASVSGLTASPTLSAERFERSQEGRFDLWSDAIATTRDHPLGIGPEGFRTQPQLRPTGTLGEGREPHNVYLAFLAERGLIGLVGLLGLGVTLWRTAPPGGVTRALLLAMAVSNLVRETLHYRHMWLFLALALALDRAVRRTREPAHAA